MADLIKELKLELGVKVGVETPPREFVSTGNLALDWAVSGSIRGGGLPVGRVVEIFGDPSTGKSLLVSHILAETQRREGFAILDDTEAALDPTFAKQAGLDLESLLMLDSQTVEEHFDKVSKVVEKIRERDDKVLIVIALDSLAMLSTKHEQETGFEKVDMTKAKMIRQGMRMLGSMFAKQNVLYIVCNHVIANVGVMYGPKTTTPGGSGVPFQSSVRIELTKKGLILGEVKKRPIGLNVNAQVVKNKIAPPFREVEIRIHFDKGVELHSGLFDVLVDEGAIQTKSQGWYLVDGKSLQRTAIEEQMEQLLDQFLKGKESK